MPTVKDIPGPYRLFFYSFDCAEPKHVHVQREKLMCKFWLKELNSIRRIIEANLTKILEAWHEHCR
jgi:hypothetical protein